MNALTCLYASSAFQSNISSAAWHVAADAAGTALRSAVRHASCIASRCASACFSIMDFDPRASGSPSLCREYSIAASAREAALDTPARVVRTRALLFCAPTARSVPTRRTLRSDSCVMMSGRHIVIPSAHSQIHNKQISGRPRSETNFSEVLPRRLLYSESSSSSSHEPPLSPVRPRFALPASRAAAASSAVTYGTNLAKVR